MVWVTRDENISIPSVQPLPLSRSEEDGPATMPTTLSTPREVIGLFEMSNTETEKTVDVIAVHGLHGNAYKTWEHENGSLWLRDFLPADIPFARILTFGYDSTVFFSGSVAKLEDKALELLNRLSAKRYNTTLSDSKPRPIVFICHSLGGIVVKKALILAHERSSDQRYKDILNSTKAVAFLGVPHKGSNSAWWANFVANALKGTSLGIMNTEFLKDLEKDSTTLSNVSKQFIDRATHLEIYTFYETRKLYGVVVCNILETSLGLLITPLPGC